MLLTKERVKLLFQAMVALAAAFALSCVGLAALQARATAVTVANDADLLTARGVDLSEQLQEVASESRHVLVNGRLALDNLNKAAIAERLYAEHDLPDTVNRVNDVLDAAHGTVSELQSTSAAASAAIRAVDARAQQAASVENDATTLLRSSNEAVMHADAVLTDPHVAATLVHLDQASAAGASTMQYANQTAADTQQAWHSVLHPAWPKRLGHALRRMF